MLRLVAAAAFLVVLVLPLPAAATAPPVGPLPKGPVTSISTHRGALVAVALPHRAKLQTHPRGDARTPLTGVFRTRSPDRPNPIGLHRVTVTAREGTTLSVHALEAIDGTPILDLKIVLAEAGG
jgi:hypothetical protein